MALNNLIQNWANTVVFTSNLVTYTLTSNDALIFGNVATTNGTVLLPSNAAPSRSFTVKRLDNSANFLKIRTDSANCLLDGIEEFTLLSVFDAMTFIKGMDGNFYSIAFAYGATTCEEYVQMVSSNGFYVTFINTNVPVIISNSSVFEIEYGLLSSDYCFGTDCCSTGVIGSTYMYGYLLLFFNNYVPILTSNSSSISIEYGPGILTDNNYEIVINF